MKYLPRFIQWCSNTCAVTDAEIIAFGNVKVLREQSSSFEYWWSSLSQQQKNDALDNLVRTTDRQLDVLYKPEARFSG